MQYHALSLARRGVLVALIGDVGTAELHPDLAAHRFVHVYPLSTFPKTLQFSHRLLFLTITAPAKILWQIASLYTTLSYAAPASAWLLVQNPPAIPTLLVARLVALLRGTHLVIDWHNFGYSILALRLGPTHPFVRLATWYEGFFGAGAAAHFAVSRAMTTVLRHKWGITALTLHDRPAAIFQPLTDPSQRETFLHRLPQTQAHATAILTGETRLLVSSTSWTPDEDFEILLQGLVQYASVRETQLLSSSSSSPSSPSPPQPVLPRIHALITGRGPLLQHYLTRISTLTIAGELPGITIENAWLSPADYALLLSAADLGVSLHMSSSGVDLPMKVVDMFGSGLPVVGWSGFEAWGELVREPKAIATEGEDGDGNGRGFRSAGELCGVVEELFGEVGRDGKRVGWSVGDDADDHSGKKALSQLERLRRGARKEGRRRWEDEWAGVAGRLLGLGVE
jgi:beta-1,4-mannosyltransferase